MRRYIPVLFLLFSCLPSFAQKTRIIDSLQRILHTVPDSEKVLILSDLSWEYGFSDLKKAVTIANTELELALKINNKLLTARAYNDLGIALYKQGSYNRALFCYEKSLKLREGSQDKALIASTLSKLGVLHTQMGNYTKALEYQLRVLKMAEQIENKVYMAYTLNNLAGVYDKLKDYEKCFEYARLSYSVSQQIGDKLGTAAALANMALASQKLGSYEDAVKYYEESLPLYYVTGDLPGAAGLLNNIGYIKRLQKKNDETIHYYKEALKISKQIEDLSGMSLYSNNVGDVYSEMGNYKLAEPYLLDALKIAEANDQGYNKMTIYRALGAFYNRLKRPEISLEYYDKYFVLMEKNFANENARQIAEMQTRYETDKKERENASLIQNNRIKTLQMQQLESTSRMKNIAIFGISLLVFLLLLAGYLFFNRQKLRQRELLAIERVTQQELSAKAILEAEEKERMRIAKELHDGIGQLLSASKLNLSALQQSAVFTDKVQAEQIANCITLVDDAVKEIRNVSHNMMPNALIKNGLARAIRDLMDKLTSTGKLLIELDIVGLEQRIEASTEIILYRILQELMGNIIKHSRASYVSVQIVKDENELRIMVEDNGVGFDSALIKRSDGIGIRNIVSRVEFLKGEIFFDTQVQKGTTVVIEIPLSA